MTLKAIDYLDSDEAVGEYESAELEIAEQNQKTANTTNLMASLRTSVDAISGEIRQLASEIETLEGRLVETEQQYREIVSRVRSNLQRDQNAFKIAFGVGEQLMAINIKRDATSSSQFERST